MEKKKKAGGAASAFPFSTLGFRFGGRHAPLHLLALYHSGRQTILNLTFSGSGSNSSTLERERDRTLQIGVEVRYAGERLSEVGRLLRF